MDADDLLVARLRQECDEEAFAELVRRYRDPVFRLAISILGQGYAGEAEEVAQEVFVRVHRALSSFRGESQLGSCDQSLAALPSLETDANDRLEALRRDRALTECIGELPEVYQSALRLHYWMGVGVSEIAPLLGVPENTVKSYLHRARRLLHAMLQERGFSNV